MSENPEAIVAELRRLAEAAKASAQSLRALPGTKKNAVLARVATLLRKERKAIFTANLEDVQNARAADLSSAMIDRLRLDERRIKAMAEAVETIAQLPDPVGEVLETRRLPNGLEVGRMRVPLGLVGIIYESRPNVTIDAAALCFKAGSAVVLRGGKEAIGSNRVLARIFGDALEAEGLDRAAVTLVPTTDRAAARALVELNGVIDVLIPRGGAGLVRFVTEHARVPVVFHDLGVCHVYVDGAADLDMAEAIVMNAKTQRPGVCNAMETLLVDRQVAETFVPRIVSALLGAGVEVRADAAARLLAPEAREATEGDFGHEFLALTCALAVVDGIDGALAHVERHGSHHTEAIVTTDYERSQRWLREVDASLVLVNASTRFNDGGALGLGAEVGISTNKLHCYGPMGLRELCAQKWVARGAGQLRE
jgi:glutamate-5-semialdehyde dehydrogenase